MQHIFLIRYCDMCLATGRKAVGFVRHIAELSNAPCWITKNIRLDWEIVWHHAKSNRISIYIIPLLPLPRLATTSVKWVSSCLLVTLLKALHKKFVAWPRLWEATSKREPVISTSVLLSRLEIHTQVLGGFESARQSKNTISPWLTVNTSPILRPCSLFTSRL